MLEVRLPEAAPKAFRVVLSYIYTDRLEPVGGGDVGGPAPHEGVDAHNTAGDERVLLMMEVYRLALQVRPALHNNDCYNKLFQVCKHLVNTY